MVTMQSWWALGLAVLVGTIQASHPDQRSIRICTDSLFTPEADVAAAVACLTEQASAQADTTLKPLLEGLFNGTIRGTRIPDAGLVAVIPGEEVLNEHFEGFHPVRMAFPYTGSIVAGHDGKPLLVPFDSLVEPDIGRAERRLLQPVLTSFGLYAADREERRTAARLLGESRDLARIPLLRAALEQAGGSEYKNLRHALIVAIARLELGSPDVSVRLKAVETLRAQRASEALPDLQALAADPSAVDTLRTAASAAAGAVSSWNRVTDVILNLFSGISLGSILILMALGLAVIFGLMGVINMAHGEFMMIGAYATFLVQNLFVAYAPGASGWFLLFSFPAAFLLAASIGMIIEATIIRHLYGRPLETLLATWGVSLLLIQIARTLFGDLTSVATPPFLAGGWEIFPQVVFPYNRLFIIALTIATVGSILLLFYRTSAGMKIRAVTQNRSMSACLGVRTRRLDAFTFGLGTGIAGLAGCALTQIGNVSPGLGQNYIVDSFMVVVTGGVGKLAGTVVAGLGIGTLNKFLEPFFQAVYAKVILLGLVILFIQWRPSGIFPAKGRHEDN